MYEILIIATVLQKVEVIMDIYGFWKVTFLIIIMIFTWRLPELITAIKS